MKYSVGQEVMSLARLPQSIGAGSLGGVALVNSTIRAINVGLVRERFASKLHNSIDDNTTNMADWIEQVSRIVRLQVEIDQDVKAYATVDWFTTDEIQPRGTKIRIKDGLGVNDLVKTYLDSIDEYPVEPGVETKSKIGDFVYVLDKKQKKDPYHYSEPWLEYSMKTRQPFYRDVSRDVSVYDIKKVMVVGMTVFKSMRNDEIKETLYYVDENDHLQRLGHDGARFWRTRDEAKKVVSEAQEQLEKYNKLISEF